jgi:hypothetical protein
VLSEIAAQVYTVERLGQLADKAAATLADLGYDNVRVLHGDGTVGWLEHTPYDAIVVAAGGPQVPGSLKAQLKIGGRLVIPVGADQRVQELVRVTRASENEYRSEDIADVRFVPLIGEEGWATAKEGEARARARRAPTSPSGHCRCRQQDGTDRVAHGGGQRGRGDEARCRGSSQVAGRSGPLDAKPCLALQAWRRRNVRFADLIPCYCRIIPCSSN